VTVLLDVRGGEGWPNPRPWAVLPWMRELARVLGPNFPERLKRMVVYPVPWVATAVWSAASAFLDERTVEKVSLLSGSASRTDPTPDGLLDFVDAETVAACEAIRQASQRTAVEAGRAVATASAPASVGGLPEPTAKDDLGRAELELA